MFFFQRLITVLVDNVHQDASPGNAGNVRLRCFLVPAVPPPVLLPLLGVHALHASGGRGARREEGAPPLVMVIAPPHMIITDIASNITITAIIPIISALIVAATHQQDGDVLPVSVARVVIPSWTLRKSTGLSFSFVPLLLAI